MAVWQFVCDLIPSTAAKIDGVRATRMSREHLDGVQLAFPPAACIAFFERLDRLLPEKQSWSPDLRIWGDEKTDDVQVGIRDGQIEDVQFRINVADLRMPIVEGFCLLARDFECALATRQGTILRPYSDSFLRAVMQSDAALYIKNPEGYLREATRRESEPK